MTCKKQVTKIEEKRELTMGMARMLENGGKKTMRTIEQQVESVKMMQEPVQAKDESTGHKTLPCFTQDITERQESLSLCLLGATVPRRPQE